MFRIHRGGDRGRCVDPGLPRGLPRSHVIAQTSLLGGGRGWGSFDLSEENAGRSGRYAGILDHWD
jgi:hypothetical protein